MDVFVVSDINSWSAFFDKLLKVHSELSGSALNPNFKQQTWNLKLINTATTQGKSGRDFPYFQAVDTGRGPVTTRYKGYIAFARKSRQKLFRKEVKGTPGEQISVKALAKIHTTFDAELREVFNEWLKTKNEGQTLRLGRVRPQQVARKNKASKAAASPEQIAEGTSHNTKARLIKNPDRAEEGGGRKTANRPLTAKEIEAKRIEALGDQWLEAGGVDTDFQGNIETEVIDKVEETTAIRTGRFKGHRERAYNAVKEKLAKVSRVIINKEELERRAIAAGVKAAFEEANRVARQRSTIVANAAFRGIIGPVYPNLPKSSFLSKAALGDNPSAADKQAGIQKFLAANLKRLEDVKKNPAIEAFIKIPNWWMMSSIFTKVTGDQIENIWKPLTPSRVDTRNFKLIYVNGGELEVLPPSTGGELRNSYKLVTNNQLEKLIKQFAITSKPAGG